MKRVGWLFLLGLNATPVGAEPRLEIERAEVIEGEPVNVYVTGLMPNEAVTLQASRRWPSYPTGEEIFRSSATFVADPSGAVNVAVAAPTSGSSYQKSDAAGLFWSMAAAGRKCSTVAKQSPKPTDLCGLPAGTVMLSVTRAGKVAARAQIAVLPHSKDVTVKEVREAGLAGVFAKRASDTPQAAVIVLGGSEGGLFTARWAAPLLASQGFAVLGVGYFQGNEPQLSALPRNLELIPLETVEKARDWLARQRGIDASRIAVVGVSKGAEMALAAASVYPWIKAVGAFAPSHVVWEGVPPENESGRSAGSSWTYKGKPLPFVRWSKLAERRAELSRTATGSTRMTEIHLESLAEHHQDIEAATIRLENSRAALFLAAGTDDGLWPAAYSSERIQRALKGRGFDRKVVIEVHPTGHLTMGSGWAPTTQFQRSTGWLPGGNAELDSKAQRAIWPSFLKFLKSELNDAAP